MTIHNPQLVLRSEALLRRAGSEIQNRHRGFTLVELLIVITIIIVLLAILLPSMGRAIEATHRAVCASNLHQLHAGHLAYASSHYGQMAVTTPSLPNSAGVGIWAIAHKHSSFAPYGGTVGSGVLYHAGVLNDGKILYCPSSTHPEYQFNTTSNSWPADNDIAGQASYIAGSYHYRGAYEATGSGDYGRTLRVTDPSSSAMMADGFARNTGSAALNAIPGVDTEHITGYNVLRLDSSVVYHDDPERVIADLCLAFGWAGSAHVSLEKLVWQNEFTSNVAP